MLGSLQTACSDDCPDNQHIFTDCSIAVIPKLLLFWFLLLLYLVLILLVG